MSKKSLQEKRNDKTTRKEAAPRAASREYLVYVPSLWFTQYVVRAKNPADAIEQVRQNNMHNVQSSDFAEYERHLEPEEWLWPVEYQKK